MAARTLFSRSLGKTSSSRPACPTHQRSRSLTFARHILNPSITGFQSPALIKSPLPVSTSSNSKLDTELPGNPPKYSAAKPTKEYSNTSANDAAKPKNSDGDRSSDNAASDTVLFFRSILFNAAVAFSMYYAGGRSVTNDNTLVCKNCGTMLPPATSNHRLWPGCAFSCQAAEAMEAKGNDTAAGESFVALVVGRSLL